MRFDWQAGDVLLIDNMLAAHGREPFTGPRRIAVVLQAFYGFAHGSEACGVPD